MHRRPVGHQQGARNSADGQGGLQQTQPLRADVKDVFGKDGQQRRRAAKQDGKQVQGDCGQNDALVEDKAESSQQRVH